MLRFLRSLLSFALVLAALAALAIFWMLPSIPLNTTSFAPYEEQLARLRESEGRRLILVGGSNLRYGVDNRQLESLLGNQFRVINLGFHAGLGIGPHLDTIAGELRKGDVVVLCPEYSLWGKSWSGGVASIVERCDAQGRNLLSGLWGRCYSGLPNEYMLYIREKVNALTGGKELNVTAGDVTIDWNVSEATPDYRRRADSIRGTEYRLDANAKRYLERFTRDAATSGCTVLISAPTLDSRDFGASRKSIEAIYGELGVMSREVNGALQIVSSPDAYAFAEDLMYNTCWHLNKRGRDIRTRQLAQDILSWQQERTRTRDNGAAPHEGQ